MKEFKDPKFFILIVVGLVLTVIAGWEYIDFKSQEEYIAPPPTKNMPVITPPTSPPPGNTGDAMEDLMIEDSMMDDGDMGGSMVHPSTYTIYMNSVGFSPASLTIKSGDTVRFVNNDTRDYWPASDVHPVHAAYSEFDPRAVVSPGQEWSFTFQRVGEWGMHDHRSPSITGKIIVK